MTGTDRLDPSELRVAIALAAIFFFRMLGLFMLLPVLALYADALAGATPLLIGAAIGIYGLTQAVFQIPMGRWSDHVGRKPVISIGLLVFAFGGAVAALSGHILGIIAGRALQGAGAISGAMLALASDLTREEQRTKVMALIGISIGFSFSVAFVLGPAIDAWIGLTGLFWVAAGLGLAALPILWFAVPAVALQTTRQSPDPRIPLRPSRELLGLYTGVFCLHGILAASFVSIPPLLESGLRLDASLHYTVYLPVLFLSLICVAPMVMLSHRVALAQRLFHAAIAILAAGELLLWLAPPATLPVYTALVAFFVGFNFLEASLPSRVSRAAPRAGRGTALGIYSTAQFTGMFAGGLMGGMVSGVAGRGAVFGACAIAGAAWLIFSFATATRERGD